MLTSVDVLFRLAEPRAGYFTTEQVAEEEVSRQQPYHYLARADSIDRVAQGIYRRRRRFPALDEHDEVLDEIRIEAGEQLRDVVELLAPHRRDRTGRGRHDHRHRR